MLILQKQQQNKKIQEKQKEKENQEIIGCTFTPKLISNLNVGMKIHS